MVCVGMSVWSSKHDMAPKRSTISLIHAHMHMFTLIHVGLIL